MKIVIDLPNEFVEHFKKYNKTNPKIELRNFIYSFLLEDMGREIVKKDLEEVLAKRDKTLKKYRQQISIKVEQ